MKHLFGIISIVLFCSFFVQEQDKQTYGSMLSDAAVELTKTTVIYDPKYYALDYPNGDLPADRGVCTDVVVRAYRKLGIDLQKEVHEDMRTHFNLYPKSWGLTKPDRNIDHRRVPNLMVYFSRCGRIKAITTNPEDYQPGDIVVWDLGGGTTHIGLVINQKSHDGKRNLIVHNIGNGQEISDCLFEYRIIGHYQYPG
ncbi:MAG TPA: DUF1287 domain-containing protein [Tenuifilaceae bacterium]|nr:DUF1287 domain-containing protein [Tenuifilaceae bacterium]